MGLILKNIIERFTGFGCCDLYLWIALKKMKGDQSVPNRGTVCQYNFYFINSSACMPVDFGIEAV
jgi:hypothetical protein